LTGLAIQALVLGTALFVAVVKLLSDSLGDSIFRYQGF